MNQQEYEQKFSEDTKAEKALGFALDIRKFEIELYWKRATYFWTFIAAAFGGYALVYARTTANIPTTNVNDNSWLLLIFSCLGFLFSVAWHLVNRGSKFWQNNWERHVDLLENQVVGPLYKIIAEGVDNHNPLTAAGHYSVSKINQILSVFISLFWMLLIFKSLLPISCLLEPNPFKIAVLAVTVSSVWCLFHFGKSDNKVTKTKLSMRELRVESS